MVSNKELKPKAGNGIDLRVEHRCSLIRQLSLAHRAYSVCSMTRFLDTCFVVINKGKELGTWV